MIPRDVSKELRKVAERYKGKPVDTFEVRISDMAEAAANAIDSLQVFVDMVAMLPTCNDCVNKECQYRPGLGTCVRYNCHLHKGKDLEPHLSPYGKYLMSYAHNHGISVEEAAERPMVKARLDYYNKTGL